MLLVATLGLLCQAQIETIYTFNGSDGRIPSGNIVFDADGSLYGTTVYGGTLDLGTVYRLSPDGLGGWQQTGLYSFTNSADGMTPIAGLTLDPSGKIWGTAYGKSGPDCPPSCGSLFTFDGSSLMIVHTFLGGKDGGLPRSTPIFDSTGNLYGSTAYRGAKGYGTVYRIEPDGKKHILHAFGSDKYGADPSGNLVLGSDGTIYGITQWAGGHNTGTIFRLVPGTKGYQLRLIHKFTAKEGRTAAGLNFANGMLYGTLPYNSGHQCVGILYSLATNSKGEWVETKLHKFCLKIDGRNPLFNPLMMPDGSFYGTTVQAVYKLSLVDGVWQPTRVIWTGEDEPWTGALTLGPDGKLYGTTHSGGTGYGTVFSVTP